METKDIDTSGIILDLLKTINMKTRHFLINEFHDKELTLHQQYILKTIKNNPEINLKALGNCLNLAKSSISLMINKLVEEGYVQRTEDLIDRRNKTIHLTETGIIALEKSKNENIRLFSSLISDLDPEGLAMIYNSLKLLNNSIDKKTCKGDNNIYECKIKN